MRLTPDSAAGFPGSIPGPDARPSGAATRLPPVPAWKRTLDLSLGLALLILLSPVMLAAAMVVRTTSRGPVIFRQTRIGRGGRPFTLYKFRTMRVEGNSDAGDRAAFLREMAGETGPAPETGLYRQDRDPRIAPGGRFLRRFSIDETPQLFNVLKGEMSLVGPRPCLPFEAEHFSRWQSLRHLVPPGVTGLWQVSGRNRLGPKEMLELDVDYVERCSLGLDLAILARTPRAALLDRFTR